MPSCTAPVPGDSLYGLRTALFGEQQQTRTDQVALASQQLAEVQQLIDEGQWDAAQDKLQTLTTTVATVNDVEQKQELVTQWQDLTVKVDAKDSNATLPPGVPPPVMPEPAGRCAGLDHVDNHVVGDEQLDVVIVGDHHLVELIVRDDVVDPPRARPHRARRLRSRHRLAHRRRPRRRRRPRPRRATTTTKRTTPTTTAGRCPARR